MFRPCTFGAQFLMTRVTAGSPLLTSATPHPRVRESLMVTDRGVLCAHLGARAAVPGEAAPLPRASVLVTYGFRSEDAL